MKVISSIRIYSMAGLGPVAWDQDIQRMSMHPAHPGHAECGAEHLNHRSGRHHIVHRHHPEEDCEVALVPREIPLHYLLPLLAGKKRVRRQPSAGTPAG